jgi:Tfp pilus assembly protein PilV
MRKQIKQQANRGFSLLETCMALLVFLIVLTGIVPLCVYAMKYNSCVSSSEVVTVGSSTASQTYTIDVTVTDATSTLKNIKIVVTPQGRSTTGSVYEGNEGWMRGQIILYTKRTTSIAGSNLG